MHADFQLKGKKKKRMSKQSHSPSFVVFIVAEKGIRESTRECVHVCAYTYFYFCVPHTHNLWKFI